jgi:hypothetical protein
MTRRKIADSSPAQRAPAHVQLLLDDDVTLGELVSRYAAREGYAEEMHTLYQRHPGTRENVSVHLPDRAKKARGPTADSNERTAQLRMPVSREVAATHRKLRRKPLHDLLRVYRLCRYRTSPQPWRTQRMAAFSHCYANRMKSTIEKALDRVDV